MSYENLHLEKIVFHNKAPREALLKKYSTFYLTAHKSNKGVIQMEWEFHVLYGIQNLFGSPWMDQVMLWLSFLGDKGGFWIGLALCLLIRKSTRRLGLVMAAALILDLILTNGILKPFIARTRPFVAAGVSILVPPPTDGSFPSGHTAASFAAAMSLWFMKSRLARSALLLAALIAFSRLYLFVHYPTDIAGGILAGTLAAYAAWKLAGRGRWNWKHLRQQRLCIRIGGTPFFSCMSEDMKCVKSETVVPVLFPERKPLKFRS